MLALLIKFGLFTLHQDQSINQSVSTTHSLCYELNKELIWNVTMNIKSNLTTSKPSCHI